MAQKRSTPICGSQLRSHTGGGRSRQNGSFQEGEATVVALRNIIIEGHERRRASESWSNAGWRIDGENQIQHSQEVEVQDDKLDLELDANHDWNPWERVTSEKWKTTSQRKAI